MKKKILFGLILGLVVIGCGGSVEKPSKKIKLSAEEIVSKMSDKEKLGQLIMMDFRNWNNKSFVAMNNEVKKVIADYKLGGVILFRENLVGTEQTVRLIAKIQNSSTNLPLLIATDQEGGYVTRLQQGTEMPGNMALGATRDLELANKVGATIGRELDALGINFNFAPVIDVNFNQKNPVIGVRSFGDNPKLVGDMATSYINGLQDQGVISTVKHFPGHGNTETDTHVGLATVSYSNKEWENIDKVPFQMAIDSGVEAIMTAHVIIPALDNTKIKSEKDGSIMGTPATLSKPIMTGVLREEMGFEGVVVTDALNMKAISENFGESQSAELAILAGGDILLMPVIVWNKDEIKKLDNLYTALLNDMKSNPKFRERVEESAIRIVKLKLEKGLTKEINVEEKIKKAEKIVGSKENKEVEKVVSEKGITLIKNENTLPLDITTPKKILFIAETKTRGNMMEKELKRLSTDAKVEKMSTDYKKGLTDVIKKGIKKSDYIVIATYNLKNNTRINEIIDYANKSNKKLVTISTRNPYDIIYTPTVKANIAIYGITGFDMTNNRRNSLEANINAGIRTIFVGPNKELLNSPTGRLPVNIKSKNGDVIYPYGTGLNFK